MATVQVTEKTFAATVKQGIVLLDFWAGGRGPCRVFAPVLAVTAADMNEARRSLDEKECDRPAPRAATAGGV